MARRRICGYLQGMIRPFLKGHFLSLPHAEWDRDAESCLSLLLCLLCSAPAFAGKKSLLLLRSQRSVSLWFCLLSPSSLLRLLHTKS